MTGIRHDLHEGEVPARVLRHIAGGDGASGGPGAGPGWPARGRAIAGSVLPVVMSFTYTTDLSRVRALVREHARQAGLPEARTNDLVIAVSEAAANTVRHARSPGTLDIWHDNHEIICQIRDQGTITDPLAGHRRPAPGALAGHGLWLVRQLCDRVELASGEDGTTVRMHMALGTAS